MHGDPWVAMQVTENVWDMCSSSDHGEDSGAPQAAAHETPFLKSLIKPLALDAVAAELRTDRDLFLKTNTSPVVKTYRAPICANAAYSGTGKTTALMLATKGFLMKNGEAHGLYVNFNGGIHPYDCGEFDDVSGVDRIRLTFAARILHSAVHSLYRERVEFGDIRKLVRDNVVLFQANLNDTVVAVRQLLEMAVSGDLVLVVDEIRKLDPSGAEFSGPEISALSLVSHEAVDQSFFDAVQPGTAVQCGLTLLIGSFLRAFDVRTFQTDSLRIVHYQLLGPLPLAVVQSKIKCFNISLLATARHREAWQIRLIEMCIDVAFTGGHSKNCLLLSSSVTYATTRDPARSRCPNMHLNTTVLKTLARRCARIQLSSTRCFIICFGLR